jgi:hypothetical protein
MFGTANQAQTASASGISVGTRWVLVTTVSVSGLESNAPVSASVTIT